MLITKQVKIKISNKKNLQHYLDLNYSCELNKYFIVNVKDLRDVEKVLVTAKCEKCNNTKEIGYNLYLKNKRNLYFSCSKKCSQEKREKTNLKKYGVENISQSKEVKDKIKTSVNEKYGVDNVFQSKEVKEKSKNTNLKKYGKEFYTQTKEYKERAEETCIKKYGKKHYSQTEEYKEKYKKTCVDKYGTDNYTKTKEYKERAEETCIKKYGKKHYSQTEERKNLFIKRKKEKFKNFNVNVVDIDIDIKNITILCDKCNKTYTENDHYIHKRIVNGLEPCTNCFPYGGDEVFISKLEKELLNFIKDNYKNVIIENDRKILNGKEIDIYLPELNLAFEFNGVYWHNELHKPKNYHLNKTNECLKKDIHLIHIYEDEWLYNKKIVQSRIKNLLGKSEKIYARKCEIKNVSFKDSKQFLINNHIQGVCVDKIRLGLYYNNELISLMTFGSLRKNLGHKNLEGNYELLRFCNKLNYSVIGGASKLFKNFLKNYKPKSIISYADKSWSKGNLYKKLGFNHINDTGVNYFYVVKGIKENRYKYRKNILVSQGYDENLTEHEIMINRNIFRIYNSGNMKFEYKNEL